MKKPILLLAILIITIVSLFGVRAFVSNRISTSGLTLGKTQDELAKVKIQNVLLKEKVYTLSSLSHIASAAAKIGFTESKSNYAIAPAQPIARR